MEDNLLNNQEIKEEKTSKRKKTKKVGKKRFLFVSLVTIILCALGWYYFSSFETTDDAFIEGHIIRISPKVTGTIENLYVDDNDFVQKGKLLLTIDDRDYKARYEQAKAAYEMALHRQSSAKVDLSVAEQDYNRYKSLYEKGAVSKQEYDIAEARYSAAQQTVFSKEKNKVADAELKQLQAVMKQAELNLSYTKIYATEDGKITNRSAEAGAYINAGAPVFSIVPSGISSSGKSSS